MHADPDLPPTVIVELELSATTDGFALTPLSKTSCESPSDPAKKVCKNAGRCFGARRLTGEGRILRGTLRYRRGARTGVNRAWEPSSIGACSIEHTSLPLFSP
jgi:hypothetical protein